MKKVLKGRRTAKKTVVTIPAVIHPEAKKFAERIRAEYDLDTLAEGYLDQATHHLSLAMFAQEMIDREGMVIATKSNYRLLHPAYRVLKESSGLFARFMDMMGLDQELPGPIGRPAGS